MLNKQMAYEKWLGIKAHDQPPTHYRLLGVDAFEADPDAISYAADGRMALLRQFQISDNAKLAEQILNELARARVVLLSAGKKEAYDTQLRQGMAEKARTTSAAKTQPTGENASQSTTVPFPVAPMEVKSNLGPDRRNSGIGLVKSKPLETPEKKIASKLWIAAGFGITIAIIAVVVARSYSGSRGAANSEVSKPVAIQTETVVPPARPMESKTVAAAPVAPRAFAAPPPDTSAVAPPANSRPAATEPGDVPPAAPVTHPTVVSNQEPPAPNVGKPVAEQADGFAQAPAIETPKSPATEPATAAGVVGPLQLGRIPVPDDPAQAEAIKEVQEIYGREIAAAKTVEQKKTLAEKILDSAKTETKDRKSQFILLRLSKNIAAQVGDFKIALQSIDETGKVFQIDSLAAKEETLQKCASLALSLEQHARVATIVARVSDEAVAADNFPVALQLNSLALSEAHKSKDDALITGSSERRTEIEAISRSFESIKPAIATLRKTPTDPDANQAVGEYRCFMKGDWPQGLPMLASGDDPKLRSLAEHDLQAPTSADTRAELGDSWWSLAEDRQGVEKRQIKARAGHWYHEAMPGLAGIVKDRAENRLQTLKEAMPLVYLADLPMEDVHVLGHETGLVFKGKPVPHAIWAHPPANGKSSHIAFELDRRFRSLRGEVGIRLGADPHSRLQFRIVGDGTLIWRSPLLQHAEESASFNVRTSSVKRLQLFVDCPGSNSGAWAMWIEPVLER
jgi:hypothetical protein